MSETPEGWEERGKPATLFRRFEFERYAQTRDFLDALAALTEVSGIHPQNINFGSTYVNLTLQSETGEGVTGVERQLAVQINALSGRHEA
jgi:pterin-4a-carbinolamine dehydratase